MKNNKILFSVALLLLKLIIAMLLIEIIVLAPVYSQNHLYPEKHVLSINSIINQIAIPRKHESVNYSEFGVWWTSENTIWNTVLEAPAASTSNSADIVCLLKDSETIGLLMRKDNGDCYQYLKFNPTLYNGWWLEATSVKNDGKVDKIAIWKTGDSKLTIGTLDYRTNERFLSMQISENLTGILLFKDSTLGVLKASLLFDNNLNTVIAVSNYAIVKDELSSIFARNDNKGWIEYAFSRDKQCLSAIALHEIIPALMKHCLLDLDGDGVVDLNFGFSNSRDSLILFDNQNSSIKNLYPEELMFTLIQSANSITTAWDHVKDFVIQSGLLGYNFPKVTKLPVSSD